MQNKVHWAIAGQTAAEIVYSRTDSRKPNMGLTNWTGANPRKQEVTIAKNYLGEDELRALNLLVSAYLDFAELQALQRRPMTMTDWIARLDDFIRISGREILTHAGKISHEMATLKAQAEYEKFQTMQNSLSTPVDRHFADSIGDLKQIEAAVKKKSGRRKKKKGGK